MKTLGIIGFGAFGRLAASHLANRFAVVVHDSHVDPAAISAAGCLPVDLVVAAAADVVLIAVPVQAMESVIMAIAPHVRAGATVIDVASVKLLPSQWLSRHIPDTTHIVATHPLFGPQSAARGLSALPLVVCPIRGERHLRVAALGEELGLHVVVTTAEEHDREMAYVQGLTHLIGRSLVQMGIPDEMLKTQSYQHLLDLTGLIGNDSFDLFSAIQTLNPFAREVVEDFVARADDLLQQLNYQAAPPPA